MFPVNKFKVIMHSEVPSLLGFPFVHCKSRRQFKHVCRIMRRSGLTWHDGTKLTDYSPYVGEETCIYMPEQKVYKLSNINSDNIIEAPFFIECVYNKIISDD